MSSWLYLYSLWFMEWIRYQSQFDPDFVGVPSPDLEGVHTKAYVKLLHS